LRQVSNSSQCRHCLQFKATVFAINLPVSTLLQVLLSENKKKKIL
jgi:hypothetical protein